MIISLAFADNSHKSTGVRLVTANYGAGRVDDCSSDEVSHD